MLQAALFHFGRVSVPAAGSEHIMAEHGLSETTMGFVYSAFLVAYTLCMMPGGWFTDRFGPRAAVMMAGFGSAGFLVLTGLCGTLALPAALFLPALIVVRTLAGTVAAPF